MCVYGGRGKERFLFPDSSVLGNINNNLWNKIQNMISVYQDNYSSLLPTGYITKATINVQNFREYHIALSEKEENSNYYIA